MNSPTDKRTLAAARKRRWRLRHADKGNPVRVYPVPLPDAFVASVLAGQWHWCAAGSDAHAVGLAIAQALQAAGKE
jgi:hypothetical protein